jgi:tetratricopeptide (TPR) repeat protein
MIEDAVIDNKLAQAVALHNRGQFASAQAIYEQILQSQPRHFDALHLLGVIAAQTGNPGRAVDIIAKALKISPNNAVAHKNRGAALQELGQWQAALDSYARAAALDPSYAEAHYCRGNVLKDTGRWEEAIACYDRAIALQPGYAEALCNRGVCLVELQRLESALADYDRAILVRPDYVEVHYNRGNVLCRQRRWREALQSFDRAIALEPDYARAYSDRAFALQELGRNQEALASCDRAVGLDPKSFAGHVNRAGVLMSLNRVDEAIASYDQAIAASPDRASAYVNRGMARLAAGDFLGGWSDYESRWEDRDGWIILERRNFSQSRWRGEASLAGRSILLQAEQGYGDTIQFCRYASLIAKLGARVIVEAPAALAGLLRSLNGVSQVVIQGEPLPPFDYHCPLLSLPLAMRTRLETIPAAVPYLRPGEEYRRRWNERLGARSCPRVGLVWSGGFRPGRPELWSVNGRRNIPLESLSRLNHSGVEFYSLQKRESAESPPAPLTARHREGPQITDLTSDIRDFADTAALIEQLDLVVSVDTATAHLAGALGKPVWILNRFDACWRWLRNRSDSPWYPTARLYRQDRAGDWDGVLARVSADLIEFLDAHPLRHAD